MKRWVERFNSYLCALSNGGEVAGTILDGCRQEYEFFKRGRDGRSRMSRLMVDVYNIA